MSSTKLNELNSMTAPSPAPDAEAIGVQRHWQATGELPRSYVAEALDGSFSTRESLRSAIERSLRQSSIPHSKP